MARTLDSDLLNRFGQYLAQCRKNANYSQGEISKILGFKSAQSISNIERGITFPPVYVLKQLVDLYKIPEREILDIVTQMSRENWKRKLNIEDNLITKNLKAKSS